MCKRHTLLLNHRGCLVVMICVFCFSNKLTWRDVQHIVVRTAKLTSPVDDGWRTNGAGFHFNHKFGFGRLDADAMVEMAKSWTTVPAQRICTGAASIEER